MIEILECTYCHSPKRRSGPEYIEELETKLGRLKTLLQAVCPTLDIDSLLDGDDPEMHLQEFVQSERLSSNAAGGHVKPLPASKNGHEILLDTMIERTKVHRQCGGCGGPQSNCGRLTLLCIIRDRCSQLLDYSLKQLLLQMDLQQAFGWNRSPSPLRLEGTSVSDVGILPSKTRAQQLISIALEDACCLLVFINRPSCEDSLNRLYDFSLDDYKAIEDKDLPLILALFALGGLFSNPMDSAR